MSTLTLRWKENRVREEIYKQHLKEIETSAHAAGWPAPNGAIVTFHEQAAPAQAVQHTRNKNNKNLICWIYRRKRIRRNALGKPRSVRKITTPFASVRPVRPNAGFDIAEFVLAMILATSALAGTVIAMNYSMH
jgi:hypothetical protein